MEDSPITLARTLTIQRVREHLRQPGVTKKEFAAAAGLHFNTLQGIEAAGWNPSDRTLLALERQLPRVAA